MRGKKRRKEERENVEEGERWKVGEGKRRNIRECIRVCEKNREKETMRKLERENRKRGREESK